MQGIKRFSNQIQILIVILLFSVTLLTATPVKAQPIPQPNWVGNDVVMVNQQGLWERWQPAQMNENINQAQVQVYQDRMINDEDINAIIIDGIQFPGGDDDNVWIRTADGRHRLTAAHNLELEQVGVENTPALQAIFEMGLLAQ